MYLRWSMGWGEWGFDNDLVDQPAASGAGSVAFISGTAASTTPTTGTFTNTWKYGRTSGNNNVNVPSMKIVQTVGGTKARSLSVGETKLLLSTKSSEGGCQFQKPGASGSFATEVWVKFSAGESEVKTFMKCNSPTAIGVVIKVAVDTAINVYVYAE